MIRKFSWLVISCICFASSTAVALGLGEIQLNSALNQPLDAKINLLSVDGVSSDSIITRLGSKEEFDRAGIERPFFLTRINFITEVKQDGSMVITLQSKEPITEPFLNFLVELDWPNGKLLREYTLLLDPPAFDDSSRYSKPQLAQPEQVFQQPSTNQSNQLTGGDYGPVTSTDTLWSIAKKVRQDSTQSVHQVMMALFDANPEAFYNNNINSLKEGALLRIPDRKMVAGYQYQSSVTLVANHNAGWGESVSPKSSTSSSANNLSSKSSNEPSGGTLSLAKPKEKESSGSQAAGTSENEEVINELQANLDASVEATEVLRQENEQLRSNLTSINERLEKLERLLELKDQQLAAVQQIAREANQAETDEESIDSSAEALDPFENASEEAIEENSESESATDVKNSGEEIVSETVNEKDASIEQEDNNTAETEVEEKPTTVTPVKTQKNEDESFVDTILSEPLYYLVPLVVILIVLILLFVRQRTMRGSEFQEKLVTPAVMDDEVKIDDDMDFADIDDTFEQDDEYTDELASDSDESDPVAEADIYIAYGKYDQAETLLRTALESDPNNEELNVKLLECLAESKDKEGFEVHYAAIAGALASGSAIETVSEMYSEAWPGESLSGAEEVSEELEDEFADLEKELKALEGEDEEELDLDEGEFSLDDTDDGVLNEDESLELEQEGDSLSLDAPTESELDDSAVEIHEEDDEFDLDFDAFDEDDDSEKQSIQESIEANNKEEYDFDLDEGFDLEDNELDDILNEDSNDSDISELDDGQMDLDSLDDELEADLIDLDGSVEDELLSLDESLEPENDSDAVDLNEIDLDADGNDDDIEDTSVSNETPAEAPGLTDEEALSNDFDFDDVAELDDLDLSDPLEEDVTTVRPVVDGAGDTLDVSSPELSDEEFDVDFDFEDSGDEFPVSDEDAVSTKLDLARAYIDMGDADGARDILQEVITEASGDSLKEAQSLLDSVS